MTQIDLLETELYTVISAYEKACRAENVDDEKMSDTLLEVIEAAGIKLSK